MPGVVSCSNLGPFGPRRGRRGASEGPRSRQWRLRDRAAAMASARRHATATPSTRPHESLRTASSDRDAPRRHALSHGPRLPRLVAHATGIMSGGLRLQRVRPKSARTHLSRRLFLFRRDVNIRPSRPDAIETAALPAGHVLSRRCRAQPDDAVDSRRAKWCFGPAALHGGNVL